MAVFPDRIVLKNSTDSQAAIEAAIQTGGTDEITQGEIVLGINPTSVQFYTKAGDGSIVTLGGTTVSTLGGLTDVDLSTPATDGQVIAYNAVSGNWEPVDQSGGGYADPLTTDGDIVIRSGGVTTRLGIGASGQVLTVTGGIPSWENAAGGATSIDDLTDVDTSTTPPTTGQLLEWDGSSWVPATLAAGGVTSIIAGTGISVDQATGDVTITATSGGGSGSGATRTSDSGTASSGELTLTGLGSSGQLHTLSTDLDAWVVFYGSAADRTADAGRSYSTDPTPGSGVLAEAYVTTAGAILFTPGTGYMNNDTTETAALYLAVRDQAGAAVNATLTVTAYVSGGGDAVDSVNGETGVVSLGIQDMDDYELNDATGTGPVSRTVQIYNSNIVTSGGVGTSLISSSYTYWAYNPDGSAAETNVLTYLRDSASFPINVDINGTIVEVQEAVDRAASGDNGGSLRLFHSGLTSTSQITGTTWVLSLATTSTLPLADGDVLQWSNADQKFKPAQLTISSNTDVDTSTAAPTDGQVLTWVDANSQWEPADATSGGGAVDSVNGETGVVSLGIQDMDDFKPNTIGSFIWDNHAGTVDSDGDWYASASVTYFWGYDASGNDLTSTFDAMGPGTVFTVEYTKLADGLQEVATVELTQVMFRVGDRFSNTLPRQGGGETVASELYNAADKTQPIVLTGGPFPTTPVALAEDEILQWSAADQAFRPVQLPDAVATRALLGIGEYADDAAAGTGGVASGAMYYNTTSADYRLKA